MMMMKTIKAYGLTSSLCKVEGFYLKISVTNVTAGRLTAAYTLRGSSPIRSKDFPPPPFFYKVVIVSGAHPVSYRMVLLLLLGAKLPLVVESFGRLNHIFPFPSILDAGYPVCKPIEWLSEVNRREHEADRSHIAPSVNGRS